MDDFFTKNGFTEPFPPFTLTSVCVRQSQEESTVLKDNPFSASAERISGNYRTTEEKEAKHQEVILSFCPVL